MGLRIPSFQPSIFLCLGQIPQNGGPKVGTLGSPHLDRSFQSPFACTWRQLWCRCLLCNRPPREPLPEVLVNGFRAGDVPLRSIPHGIVEGERLHISFASYSRISALDRVEKLIQQILDWLKLLHQNHILDELCCVEVRRNEVWVRKVLHNSRDCRHPTPRFLLPASWLSSSPLYKQHSSTCRAILPPTYSHRRKWSRRQQLSCP